jgi:ribosomal 30S subunit maturation factor RimM
MGTVLQVHQTGPVDILEMSLTDGEVGYVPALAVNIADIRADPVQLHPAARELLG